MTKVFNPYIVRDVEEAAEKKLFSAVSICAGGGGSSTGLKLAGGDVRAAIEFSRWAINTYRRNYPDCYIYGHDLRSLRGGRALEDLLSEIGIGIGELDYLDASPPCQPHSQSGSGIGDPSRMTLHSGVRQSFAATLPFDVAELLHVSRAKVSVMENVLGLIYRSKDLFDRILHALRFKDGARVYFVNWGVLSADEWGVGQRRKRVLAVSIRVDVGASVGIRSDEDVLSLFPQANPKETTTIRSALAGLMQSREDEHPFYESIRRSKLPDLLEQLPKCPSKILRLKNVQSYYTLGRCSWDHPAPTLVIAGQKPDSLSGAIHPELDRKFTIPELKRLFGLPDDYQLVGTVDQAVDTICNMVPPFMTKAISQSIYEKVLKPYRDLTDGQ